MLRLVVLSAVFAVSVASPLACCLPSRWSGLMQELGGAIGKNETEGHVTDNWLSIQYDYAQGKQYVVSHERDEMTGLRGTTNVLYNYRQGMLHIVTSDGKCETKPLDPHGMYDPCLLKTYTYGDSYTIGSSKKRFQINTYTGMLGKARFSMAVTADNHCFPVADKLYGSDENGSAVYTFLFLNITTTGVDDSLFDMPAACKPAVISTGVGRRDIEALGIQRRPLSYI